MYPVAIECRHLIQEYFDALSGQAKTEKLMDQFICDAGLKEHIRIAEAAFPKYKLTPSLLVAEGDLVAARCTFQGVQKGEFAGIPPTGKAVSVELMIFYRIREGKIVQHWMQMDQQGLMDQLSK
jgi:predicted ester cyclase